MSKLSFNRINAYHIMWLFVFFDMPTETETQRKAYTNFRKSLLNDGFTMMQYSVYVRHCPSLEYARKHIQRVKDILPKEGLISMLTITDKQYGDMENFIGKAKETTKQGEATQLRIF